MKRHKVTNKSLRKQITFALILKGGIGGKGICRGNLKSICERSGRWGNICCIDCRFLSRCVQKWESTECDERVCYLLKQRGYKEHVKWCSALLDFFKGEYK